MCMLGEIIQTHPICSFLSDHSQRQSDVPLTSCKHIARAPLLVPLPYSKYVERPSGLCIPIFLQYGISQISSS